MASVGATKEKLLAWAQGLAMCGDRRMDPAGGFILYKMAQFADADCCTWIHVPKMAADVRVSERTVQYRMREFEAAGLIRRTGRTHAIETRAGVRELPVYQLAPEVEGLGFTACSGAESAPEGGASGAKSAGFGCKSLHLYKEPLEPQSETNVSSAGAGEREALFDEVQGAFPKRGLGFTHLERARAHFWRLLDEGLEAGRIVAAAGAYAADRTVKNRDVGLDVWLADGRWRGWADVAGSPAEAAPLCAAFAGPSALRAALVRRCGEAAVASYLDPCSWDETRRMVTPRTGAARRWLAERLRGLPEADGVSVSTPGGGAPSGGSKGDRSEDRSAAAGG